MKIYLKSVLFTILTIGFLSIVACTNTSKTDGVANESTEDVGDDLNKVADDLADAGKDAAKKARGLGEEGFAELEITLNETLQELDSKMEELQDKIKQGDRQLKEEYKDAIDEIRVYKNELQNWLEHKPEDASLKWVELKKHIQKTYDDLEEKLKD